MVDRKNITKSEKLTYLQLCLTDDAKILTDGYTEISNDNYDMLMMQLENRYGLERLIVRDHVYKLLDMPNFNWNSLSSWLNLFVSHIRSLEASGMDLEANSSFIVCLVQKRMPASLLNKWEEEIAEEKTFCTKTLLDFLEVKAKSAMSSNTNDKARAVVPQSPAPQSGQKKHSATKNATASVLNASMSLCPIDGIDHKLESCPVFRNYSPEKRKLFASENKLCFKCLRQLNKHDKRACTAHCELCPSHFKHPSHNTLLHLGPKKEMSGRTNDK